MDSGFRNAWGDAMRWKFKITRGDTMRWKLPEQHTRGDAMRFDLQFPKNSGLPGLPGWNPAHSCGSSSKLVHFRVHGAIRCDFFTGGDTMRFREANHTGRCDAIDFSKDTMRCDAIGFGN